MLTYILAEELATAPGQLPYLAVAFCYLEIPLLTDTRTAWFQKDTEAVTIFCAKLLHSGGAGSSFSGTGFISVLQDMNYVSGKVLKTP